ncbi:MAG: DUF1573 domain-containing protein [Ferruginibacter sp.]|nr:DUF1573 domain-containing protein [Ferruginibacter sp.]
MKKHLFFLLAVVAFISCNIRRNDKVVDDAVKQSADAMQHTTMVQVIDSVYNFGKVREGEKVTFNFRFKNIGGNPLVITSTSASCGCTVPEKPEKPVLPGETGFIKVVFNSQGRTGHNEKNITVLANTNPEFPLLVLTGDVTGAK